MEVLSISSLNKTLQSLNFTFESQTKEFSQKIQEHEGKFTHKDLQQFKDLIEEIKLQAIARIKTFFKHKIQAKTQIYERHIEKYQSAAEDVQNQLLKFQTTLREETLLLKQQQNRKESLMEHFSKKYRYNFILKQAFGAFKKNHQTINQQKNKNNKMLSIYHKNLMKKVFFPWRSLTYKDGYELTVKEEVYNDVSSIHTQYQSIINILKAKITQTDELTKIKKAAKGEFAYALNKNLLKTISNLSLEVMSLNQIALNDGEVNDRQSKNFMGEVNMIIAQKMREVQKYRRHIRADESNKQEQQKKSKKIRFVQN